METWEKELRNHNIEKAIGCETGFEEPIEEIVKGRSHPLGTKRVWGGVEYEKKPEGWMPTGKKETVQKENIEEKKTRIEDNSKSILSKENLKKTKTSFDEISTRLDEIGFAKHHRNFDILKKTYDEFQRKGEELSNKIKDIELKFDFEAEWYDQRRKASLTGLVSIRKWDLIDKYKKEYYEKKDELAKYGSTNHWLAGRLKELCDSTGVKTTGGSSSFAYNFETVSIFLSSGSVE